MLINLQDSCRTTNSHDQVCIFLLQKNITQKGKNQITNNAKNGNKGSGGPSKDSTSTPPTDGGGVGGGGFVGKQWKKYSNYLSFNEIYNLINENVHTFQSVCLFISLFAFVPIPFIYIWWKMRFEKLSSSLIVIWDELNQYIFFFIYWHQVNSIQPQLCLNNLRIRVLIHAYNMLVMYMLSKHNYLYRIF